MLAKWLYHLLRAIISPPSFYVMENDCGFSWVPTFSYQFLFITKALQIMNYFIQLCVNERERESLCVYVCSWAGCWLAWYNAIFSWNPFISCWMICYTFEYTAGRECGICALFCCHHQHLNVWLHNLAWIMEMV